MARLALLTRSHHKRVVLSTLVSMVSTLVMIIPPYMTKLLVDQVYPNQDETLLGIVVISTALVTILADLMVQARDYFISYMSMRMGLGTNFEFYRHVSGLDLSFFESRKVGEISARARDALDAVTGFIASANSLLANAITLAVFPPILFFVNWKLALLCLAVTPLSFGTNYLVARLNAKRERQVAALNAETNARKVEFLSGISTIQALSLEDRMLARIRGSSLDSARIRLGVVLWQRGSAFVAHALRAIGTLCYTWFGWSEVLAGTMSLGTFLAFSMYSGYLTGPINGLLGIVVNLPTFFVHLERFTEVYERRTRIESPRGALAKCEGVGGIALENVSFRYDSGSLVLEGLNLDIDQGSKVGIVGTSGAGKTTLVQLIPRFFDPTEGVVRIGGHDIRRYDVKWLRQQISYVQQEPFLFSGSILDNIAIAVGSREVDRAAIEDAAGKACIHDAIMRLPKGYDTPVGEWGRQLSQGQRQRIALARVLLRKTRIVILDEATSALDLPTEEELLDVLAQELRDCATIIVSHRPTAIRDADKVFLLDKKTIAAEGDFRSLLGSDSRLQGALSSSAGVPPA